MMKRTNSLPKKIMNMLSILAIVIASLSTFSLHAQIGDEPGFEDVATEMANGPKSCYTLLYVNCGINSQETVICNFNDVYGKPYECTELDCSGKKSKRTCVYISK